MFSGRCTVDLLVWPAVSGLRYPLGDFNYNELAAARPLVAGMFFTLYVAMVFLVCLNLIIGGCLQTLQYIVSL